jgi:hypothetical protein
MPSTTVVAAPRGAATYCWFTTGGDVAARVHAIVEETDRAAGVA